MRLVIHLLSFMLGFLTGTLVWFYFVRKVKLRLKVVERDLEKIKQAMERWF